MTSRDVWGPVKMTNSRSGRRAAVSASIARVRLIAYRPVPPARSVNILPSSPILTRTPPARPGRRLDSPRAGVVDPVRAATIIAEAETIALTSVGAEPIEPDTAFPDGLVRAGVDVEDQPADAP